MAVVRARVSVASGLCLVNAVAAAAAAAAAVAVAVVDWAKEVNARSPS